MNNNEPNYLTFDQAEELVGRIANRAANFDYTMSTNYKEDSLFQWEESDGTHYCLSW